jgi:hypothetical protein
MFAKTRKRRHFALTRIQVVLRFSHCWSFIAIVFFLLSFGPATPCMSQNLLLNPDFDSDVSNWVPRSDVSIEWNPLDAGGSTSSGSGEVTNSFVGISSQLRVYQCVNGISEQQLYEFRGKIFLPSGQPTLRQGIAAIWWRSDPNCYGSISTSVTPIVGGPFDTWIEMSTGLVVSPTGAQSAYISLGVHQNAPGGSVSALFDELVFHGWAPIFIDGFESGDTALWSRTVP